ncbi:hypothetical protein K7X08_022147 [Anisodus acutangulus]|uniref:Uncharacterized protein n=1 Tax=Anisodus acutangulus TaxID=402998 RepID=A0A9Q1L525_9SOLA|nr:hypothetical protein K7X08_022147 [Anisodus acutangulus]
MVEGDNATSAKDEQQSKEDKSQQEVEILASASQQNKNALEEEQASFGKHNPQMVVKNHEPDKQGDEQLIEIDIGEEGLGLAQTQPENMSDPTAQDTLAPTLLHIDAHQAAVSVTPGGSHTRTELNTPE